MPLTLLGVSSGDSAASDPPRAYLGAPAQVVAYRAATPGSGQNDATKTDWNTRLRHVAAVDCAQLRLVYSSWNATEALPGNDVTINASIEYPAATFTPVTFYAAGGGTTYTLKSGGTVVSDPIPVDFKDGDVFWSRTHAVVTLGQVIPRNVTTNTSKSEGAISSTSASDLTASGTISDSNTIGFGPNAVLGHAASEVPSVALVGDSIITGQGDTLSEWGFAIRALEDQFALVRVSRGGDTATSFATIANSPRRRMIAAMAKYAICNYGVNDMATAATEAQIKQYLTTIWLALARSGVSVYQCTITPRNTSSDSWATTAGQTVTANESKRTGTNDWVRGGAPLDPLTLAPVAVGTSGALVSGAAGHPLAGYFETADAVETARNSGKWKNPVDGGSTLTTDGLHPNATAHGLLAAAINTAVLT